MCALTRSLVYYTTVVYVTILFVTISIYYSSTFFHIFIKILLYNVQVYETNCDGRLVVSVRTIYKRSRVGPVPFISRKKERMQFRRTLYLKWSITIRQEPRLLYKSTMELEGTTKYQKAKLFQKLLYISLNSTFEFRRRVNAPAIYFVEIFSSSVPLCTKIQI